ncbi:MAG: endonuclease Q family protein, partial [Kiritimatiellaeota bacterium]|nr:endonuclease Q family protein [Kiritimatiellota bacterium]
GPRPRAATRWPDGAARRPERRARGRRGGGGQGARGGAALPYQYIIPLPELVQQALGVGPSSQKAMAAYRRLLAEYGSELPLLLDRDADTLGALGKIGDCIRAVREGRVIRQGGFDGKYGVIRAEV